MVARGWGRGTTLLEPNDLSTPEGGIMNSLKVANGSRPFAVIWHLAESDMSSAEVDAGA